MDMKTSKQGNVTTLSVKGRIDAVTAPDFEKFLGNLMAQGEINILLDFKELEYISSAGLRSVLSAAKQLKAGGGKMIFAELQGSVKDVFKISGFGSIFKIYDTVGEALTQF